MRLEDKGPWEEDFFLFLVEVSFIMSSCLPNETTEKKVRKSKRKEKNTVEEKKTLREQGQIYQKWLEILLGVTHIKKICLDLK